MSEWRPFQLLGRDRLAAITERVNRVLPDLARDWWAGASPIQLVAVSAWSDVGGQHRGSPVRCLLRESDVWLAFLGPEHAWLEVIEGWLGCELHAMSPLAQRLQREFCLALFAKLTGREAAPTLLAEEDLPQLPPQATRAGAGTVVIELDIGAVPLTLVAPVEIWPELAAPAVRATQRSLTEAFAALADTRLSLDVRLPGVPLSMAEAATLNVGDFLDLRHDLSGRVQVLGTNMSLRLEGVLGQANGQKAIRLQNDESEKK
jgi:hypothetical protein